MQPLTKAIYSKWTATAGIVAAIAGGLSLDVAEEGTALPHMVYQVVGAPLDEMYGNSKRYEATVQFTLYHGGDDQAAMVTMKVFTDVFDDLLLTLDAGTNFDTSRTDEPWSQRAVDADGVPIKDEAGNPVYQVITHYRFSVA